MPQERDVIQILKDKNPQTVSLAEAKEAEPTMGAVPNKEVIRAKIARILERGIINERLQVLLPSDVHGEWVPDDATEITRMKDMGFEIDTQYAKNRVLHAGGDGALRTGDVVFMVCPKYVKDIIDEVKHTRYMETHFPKKNAKGKTSQGEESAFQSQVAGNLDMPVIEESTTHRVTKSEIEAALARKP